jgi:hypothetical protein
MIGTRDLIEVPRRFCNLVVHQTYLVGPLAECLAKQKQISE